MDKGREMIELFDNEKVEHKRHSSKGNQLKWKRDDIWYKADYLGYEGLAEVIVSQLLSHSDLKDDEYVLYTPIRIKAGNAIYNGAESRDFLKPGSQLITLERLYKTIYGRSLHEEIFHIHGIENRIEYLVSRVKECTELADFGTYLNRLLTIDALFLNKDRHMHNIAVIKKSDGSFDYCPIFDNGGALLSDTSMDYPMNMGIYEMIPTVKAKTVSDSFDEQLDASEKLYGYNLKFSFNNSDIEKAVQAADIYEADIRERVITVLREQRRKYPYLFE